MKQNEIWNFTVQGSGEIWILNIGSMRELRGRLGRVTAEKDVYFYLRIIVDELTFAIPNFGGCFGSLRPIATVVCQCRYGVDTAKIVKFVLAKYSQLLLFILK